VTETSGPFKAAVSGDRWQETDWGNMMKRLFSDGVFSGYLNELEVVEHTPSADMYADVKTGGGWVQGHIHANSALKAMTIDAAHATLDRTDRIVLRRTYNSPNSEIALAVLKGVDAAAGTSTPKALTQNSTTWEISLATVLVAAAVTAIYTADITDERRSAYCGVAAATLGDFAIDTSGNLDGGGMEIVDIADPTTDQSAATKKFLADNYVAALNAALTGTPTAPTAALGTDTTQIATTAFVQDALQADGQSGALGMVTTDSEITRSLCTVRVAGTFCWAVFIKDCSAAAYIKIYKNGVESAAASGAVTNSAYDTRLQTFAVVAGDIITLKARDSGGAYFGPITWSIHA